MTEYDPKAWQRLGTAWDNNFTDCGLRPRILQPIEWMLKADPSSILDVGCCTGYFIRKLRDEGYQGKYLGVDITPNLINKARQLSPKEDFDIMDAQELELEDDTFDLVLCAGVLMHLPELEQPMSELFRVAKRYVLISCYGTRAKTHQTRHSGEFLNFVYRKEDIEAHVPKGWKETEFMYLSDLILFLFEVD